MVVAVVVVVAKKSEVDSYERGYISIGHIYTHSWCTTPSNCAFLTLLRFLTLIMGLYIEVAVLREYYHQLRALPTLAIAVRSVQGCKVR